MSESVVQDEILVDADPALITNLRGIAAEIALGAGRIIYSERPPHVEVADTKSSATDVVTLMDQRSEAHIASELSRLRPEDGLLGEEGANRPSTSGITWVVDPIDGTVNYLYGINSYSVSIAACDVVGGVRRALAGVVYNPASDTLYTAGLGQGATRRTTRGTTLLSLEGPGPALAQSLIGTGFGYTQEQRTQQVAVLTKLLPTVRDIRRMGSAALDLCAVAAGELDGYYESGLNEWDMAAGALIVAEAGGRITGGALPDGQYDVPNKGMVVAAHPGIHAGLIDLIS